MSLLDDFDIIDASVSKKVNNNAFTRFIDDFIVRYSGEVMFSRHQISSDDFGISVVTMKDKIHKYVYHIKNCNYTIEVTWDLSDWLEKSAKYCYIGFDYLYINNKCTIKFKLFDATKHIPKDGIIISERCSPLYSWFNASYKNTAHANELDDYKILSVGNMYRDTYEGWMVFDIDNVISWITNKPSSTNDEYNTLLYPNIYKVIPYNLAESDYEKYNFEEIFKSFN